MPDIKFNAYSNITATVSLIDENIVSIEDEQMQESLVLDKEGIRNLIIALQRIAAEME